MKARLDGPDWHAKTICDVGQRKPDVVVEHEYRSLLEGEPAEGSVELIPVVHSQDAVRIGTTGHLKESNLCREATRPPALGVALVGQNPVHPRFKSVGIPKRAQLAPGLDERGLHGILGQVGIAQDPKRDCHASITNRTRKGVEGLSITQFRAVHECSMHRASPFSWPRLGTRSP
jgi:hypothetical protein